MTRAFLAIAILGAALSLAAAVLAQPAPGGPAPQVAPPPPSGGVEERKPGQMLGARQGRRFAILDRDGDEAVGPEEFREAQSVPGGMFELLDADEDGVVSRQEFMGVGGGARRSGLFATLDRNGDGRLTPDEVTRHAEELFAALDTNGDGRLIRQELMAGVHRAAR